MSSYKCRHLVGVILPMLSASAGAAVPFPDELARAAIEVKRLESILDDALIIGNGDVNGLIWAEKGRLSVMLTKNDVWDARLDSKLDPPIPTLDLIRKHKKNPVEGGKAALLPDGWTRRGKDSYHSHPYPCPRACAKLVLGEGSTNAAATPASGNLELHRAVATVRGTTEAEIRVLADRNVFLIRSSAAASLAPVTSADTPGAETGSEGDVRWLAQALPGDPGWAGMSYAVAVARAGEWQAVAIVTSREAADPRMAADKLARETLATGSDGAIKRHETVWETFWGRSGIKLQDTFLTDTWYRNLYFLRCVTKPGVIAPGLFAGLVDSTPLWHGDYHLNYNLQQTFWGPFNTNHPELAEPYASLIHGYLPRARWLCKQIFGFEGAYFPHTMFAYEPDPECVVACPNRRQYIHNVWGYTMGVSAFTVQPVWWQYKYQPDRAFLETVAYPLVRDVALFQANFMDQCEVAPDGKVVLGPTVSPEHWGWTTQFERNRNSTFDIALFRYLFEAAIEGAGVLGRDQELVARWKAALGRLPAYPTTGGDTPVVVDVLGAPPITYNLANPVFPVFPGNDVTFLSSPEELALFSRTVEQTRWNGNNSIYVMGVSKARLSIPNTHTWLRNEILARQRPNQTITLNRLGANFNNGGHYTEQFAASMAIGELVLQSVKGVIRVFPAWPGEEDAAFVNLRAEGGFLVSAEQKSGEVVKLEIESTVGGRLRLVSPWQTMEANGKALTPDERGIVALETKKGERVALSRQGRAP